MANLLDDEEGSSDDELRVNELIDMVLELIYLEFAEDIEDCERLRKKLTSFV